MFRMIMKRHRLVAVHMQLQGCHVHKSLNLIIATWIAVADSYILALEVIRDLEMWRDVVDHFLKNMVWKKHIYPSIQHCSCYWPVPVLSTEIRQTSIRITVWIGNHIYIKYWDAITQSCSNFNAVLIKPLLKIGHGWVTVSQMKRWMQFLIHVLIRATVKPLI